MSRSLPDWIDARRLAESGRELRGSLPLAAMRRLAPSLHDTAGDIEIVLNGVFEGRTRCLHGHLTTTLTMICQRCLEPVALPVALRFKLGLVKTEQQAERLPEDLEPLLVTEPTLRLADLVEDELILALPIVVLHPGDSACAARVPATAPVEPEALEEKPRKNPFAVLSELKNSH